MIQSKYIQGASISNIREILLIEQESYLSPWSEKHFKDDINNQNSINYIYKRDEELFGYLFGYLIDSEYHLNKITVKKKYRQNNIGKTLFYHCLDELVFKNVARIQLEVGSLNLIAQNFYKNIGFIQVGLRKKYYSKYEDALLYNLEMK